MSNLTAIEYIQERSEATPGLWNQRFSTISANLAALNSDVTLFLPSGDTFSLLSHLTVGGRVSVKERLHVGATPSDSTLAQVVIGASSAQSDYILFTDTSDARSDYLLGSRVGGTADGLNLWDLSGNTMIASFSKQSVRFYQTVVGAVFDSGGAVVNPKSFGAVGDGVTSDTTALQAAMNVTVSTAAGSTAEQSRTVLDLAGGTYLINSALTFADVQGIIIQNGVLLAANTFPSGRFLLEVGRTGSSTGSTSLTQIENVTFDAGRYTGVGCLSLTNHLRTTIRACYFRKYGSYGIRSQNGTGISNELIISNCRFDEWPWPDTPGSASSGTAINIDHNDSLVEHNIIAYGRAGISLGQNDATAQYNRILGNQIYPGNVNFPHRPTLHVETNSNHNLIRGNYLTDGVLRIDDPYSTQIIGNLFLTETSSSTFAFVRFHRDVAVGDFQEIIVRENLFHCNSTTTVSAFTITGNQPTASGVSWWSTDISLNMAAGAVRLQSLDSLIPASPFFDSGNTNGAVVCNYNIHPHYTLTVNGDVSDVSLTNIPQGRSMLVDILQTGGSAITFSSTISWLSGWLPRISANTFAQLRFTRVNNSILMGEQLGAPLNPLGQVLSQVGSAILPSFAVSSESSLGFYRSAASVMELSYGTFVASGFSAVNAILASRLSSTVSILTNELWASGVSVASRATFGPLVATTGDFNTTAGYVRAQAAAGQNPAFYLNVGGTDQWILYDDATDAALNFFTPSSTKVKMTSAGNLLGAAGTILAPGNAFLSEVSLGWYRSGVSTMALSYGSFNLNQARLLSVRTLGSSFDSTQVAVNEVAFGVRTGTLAATQLAINSGGTIYYFDSSSSTKG